MKLAIFPGTFNPIHIAHLLLAETARYQFNLDLIYFIPSNIPPHRHTGIADARHRFNMVDLSCQNNPFFKPSEIELKREGPSYTYDTLIKAKEVYPDLDELFMIIGADAIRQLHTWHNCQNIVDITHFLVANRPDNPDIKQCLQETNLNNFKISIINSPLMEISSTLVRANITRGYSIKFLVDDLVREYIHQNDLYRE
ncbi:MAG: nicotinate-nucleotide adenylyltransferase [Cyanobacteriota bacterium]